MKIIKTKVIGDTITPIEQGYVIENQVNQYAIEFDFDETWNFEEKYCIFQDEFEEQTFKRAIINNQVIVPSELLNGRITIQVYGQNIENDVITNRQPSLKYVFSILNSLPTNASEEQNVPTPTQWELYIEQIEEMCNNLQDQFDDLKEDCETKCNDVIERLAQDEQDIQTNTDNIRTNAEAIDKLNTDLLDYSLISETGNKLSMSINPQTYVITLSLKDKNDNILSIQSVDLPLETMIISASYSNGILTFTLKNGQTLEVPISDLISGLVSTDTFNQAVQGLSNRITTIENDYLKASDKTELQNQITSINSNLQEQSFNLNLLDKNLEEIYSKQEYFSNIMYTRNFEKEPNESAIGFLYNVPQDWKYVKMSSNYKFALIRENKTTSAKERIYWFNEYTFDHDHYYYNIYFFEKNEVPLDISLYSELKIYGYSQNYLTLLNNKEKIEYSNIGKEGVPNLENMWESGMYDWAGVKADNYGAIRTKDALPNDIIYIKVNDAFKMAVTRKSKINGNVERFYWFNEYYLDNSMYEYKIHIMQKNEFLSTPELNYKYVKFYKSNDYIKQFIDNIDIDYEYDSTTNANYSVIRIYKNKLDGTQQFPFVVAPNGANAGDKSTYDLIQGNNNYVLAINSGLGNAEHIPDGIIIENSTVIQNTPSVYHDSCKPLTIDSNGDLDYAEANADAYDLVQNGIVSAVCGFMPIIINYQAVPSSEWNNIEHYTQNAQRQIIGQFGNGDYAIVTCEGRGFQNSDGWTIAEAQTICQKLGLKFAYNLDGGGSTETIICKKQFNSIYENNTGRIVPTFIVFTGKTTL